MSQPLTTFNFDPVGSTDARLLGNVCAHSGLCQARLGPSRGSSVHKARDYPVPFIPTQFGWCVGIISTSLCCYNASLVNDVITPCTLIISISPWRHSAQREQTQEGAASRQHSPEGCRGVTKVRDSPAQLCWHPGPCSAPRAHGEPGKPS